MAPDPAAASADGKKPARPRAFGVFHSHPVRCVLYGHLLIVATVAWLVHEDSHGADWQIPRFIQPFVGLAFMALQLAAFSWWLWPLLLIVAIRLQRLDAPRALWAILAECTLFAAQVLAMLPLVQ